MPSPFKTTAARFIASDGKPPNSSKKRSQPAIQIDDAGSAVSRNLPLVSSTTSPLKHKAVVRRIITQNLAATKQCVLPGIDGRKKSVMLNDRLSIAKPTAATNLGTSCACLLFAFIASVHCDLCGCAHD